MSALLNSLGTFLDFLLVVLGFGFIVFVHELGHFLAARWAGIRVLAFAIGFGPPMFTWRQGLGLRRASSEREYLDRTKGNPRDTSLSPTEYRLNWLPFGGYVKMLGQDDLDPTAVSSAPDSYQNCKPWKRMVVISAGVVMNVILSAFLFVLVFRVGLKTEPAVVGYVDPGSAGGRAVAVNASDLGIQRAGLMPGDEIVRIDGRKPNSFNDLVVAVAMSGREDHVHLTVRRPGVPEPLRFEVKPQTSPLTKLLELGVEPARSTQIFQAKNTVEEAPINERLSSLGLVGVKPGMRLIRVGENRSPSGAEALLDAARASAGRPFEISFADEAMSDVVTATLAPKPELQVDQVATGSGSIAMVRHIAGLVPVMKVGSAEQAKDKGLRDNDIFARLGPLEYPSVSQGIPTIRQHAGRTIDVVVLRRENGTLAEVPLAVKVSGEGTIGFIASDTADDDTLVAVPPREFAAGPSDAAARTPPASGVVRAAGTRVTAVNGAAVHSFADIRREVLAAANAVRDGSAVTVAIELQRPGLNGAPGDLERESLVIPAEDAARVRALSWVSPIDTGIFMPREALLKSDSIGGALRMGLDETKRVMAQTYLTFARLFQGTVKVEHLKGPVGIAHIGTRIAERGLVWLLFFMALISINLAVVNFLPLPIADGGQFIFLLIEQVRGKPVPLGVQNAATIAGLVLIGSMFLIVTFNDVMGLFGK